MKARLGRAMVANSASLLTLFLRVLGVGVAFVLHVLLARLMQAEHYGSYAATWTWVIVLSALAPLGVQLGATRFVAVYVEQSDRPMLRGFLLWSNYLVLGSACLFALILFCAISLLNWPGETTNRTPHAIWAAAAIVVLASTELGKGVARGAGWQVLAYGPGYILRPLLLIAVLAVWMVLGTRLGVADVLAMSALAGLAAAALQWRAIIGRLEDLKACAAKTKGRVWLRTSLPLMMVEAQTLLLAYSDIIFLQFFLTSTDIALYFVAAKVAALASFPHIAISAAAAKPIAAAHARGDLELVRQLSRKFTMQAAYPTLVIAAVLAISGGWLLQLFGAAYSAGYTVLQILVLGLVLQAATGPLKFTLAMTGSHKAAGVFSLAGLGLNIVLNLLLIPRFGIEGAAAATCLTTALSCGVMVLYLRQKLGFWSVLSSLPFFGSVPGGRRLTSLGHDNGSAEASVQ